MRVMFAGGGTGGHIYPAIAVAREIVIRKPDAEILFMAGTKGMERRIIEEAGYDMVTIPAAGLPRKLSPSLVPFVWKFAASILKSRSVIRRFRPSVMIATGGYVSGAPLIASHFLGVPSVIQEQNSYPGVTNRKLAGYADIVFLGFADAEKFFPAGKDIRITGNPVRNDIGTGERDKAAALFGLDPGIPTVLVFGGSQGSRALNMALAGAADMIAERGIQLIWQTGRNEFERYRALDGSSGGRIRVIPYIDDMVSAFAAADCAIARAGAMTIAEITACGLPAIFVPLPTAAANHQEHNARSLADSGAAVMILEHDLTPESLLAEIGAIMDDEKVRSMMSGAAKRIGKKDAAAVIAETVIGRYAA